MLSDEQKIKLKDLLLFSKTAALGTVMNDQPYVSMISFLVSDSLINIYILLSDLAYHTKNIKLNNKVSLMIKESDMIEKDPQSLVRVTIQGTTEILNRSENNYHSIKSDFVSKNPSSDVYFNLGGFNLYKVRIQTVRFIAGFGKTVNLSADSLVTIVKNGED